MVRPAGSASTDCSMLEVLILFRNTAETVHGKKTQMQVFCVCVISFGDGWRPFWLREGAKPQQLKRQSFASQRQPLSRLWRLFNLSPMGPMVLESLASVRVWLRGWKLRGQYDAARETEEAQPLEVRQRRRKYECIGECIDEKNEYDRCCNYTYIYIYMYVCITHIRILMHVYIYIYIYTCCMDLQA